VRFAAQPLLLIKLEEETSILPSTHLGFMAALLSSVIYVNGNKNGKNLIPLTNMETETKKN